VGARPPGLADVLIMVGMPAAVAALWLMALRLVPAVSLWEHKHHQRVRSAQVYVRALVPVLATPEDG
jgi:hypothetical protein